MRKKPPIVNQQCVVYQFQCDLCDVSYVGYTLRHLHQRVGELKICLPPLPNIVTINTLLSRKILTNCSLSLKSATRSSID